MNRTSSKKLCDKITFHIVNIESAVIDALTQRSQHKLFILNSLLFAFRLRQNQSSLSGKSIQYFFSKAASLDLFSMTKKINFTKSVDDEQFTARRSLDKCLRLSTRFR